MKEREDVSLRTWKAHPVLLRRQDKHPQAEGVQGQLLPLESGAVSYIPNATGNLAKCPAEAPIILITGNKKNCSATRNSRTDFYFSPVLTLYYVF